MLINIKHTKKKGIITLSNIQFGKQHPHFPRQAQSLHFAIYSLKKKSYSLLKLITVDYLGKTISEIHMKTKIHKLITTHYSLHH